VVLAQFCWIIFGVMNTGCYLSEEGGIGIESANESKDALDLNE
jgi:hypothetical protein